MSNVNPVAENPSVQFHDFAPVTGDFLTDVKTGLSQAPRRIAPKYFYDQRGSELFDEICRTPEYYPTRTEIGILQDNAAEIAEWIGSKCVLVELGSGASEKVRLLFDALRPASYFGVDISREFLLLATGKLAADFPWLDVHAVCADFSGRLELPEHCGRDNITAFYPGSSIGNFDPESAVDLLRQIAATVGAGGKLLIGVDLKKDPAILNAAYNDSEGVTAAFNLNLLHRMRNELGADVSPAAFEHYAGYEPAKGRVEMHLVSKQDQVIRVDGQQYLLARHESLHTENSYKYHEEEFAELAARAGFQVMRVWTDRRRLFSVQLLENIGTQDTVLG